MIVLSALFKGFVILWIFQPKAVDYNTKQWVVIPVNYGNLFVCVCVCGRGGDGGAKLLLHTPQIVSSGAPDEEAADRTFRES